MEEKKEISLEEVSIASRETKEILDKNELAELVKSHMNRLLFPSLMSNLIQLFYSVKNSIYRKISILILL